MKYKEVSNDWFTPIRKNWKAICCDCGLVHNINFRIYKNKIQIKIRRNNRSTALSRRNKGRRQWCGKKQSK